MCRGDFCATNDDDDMWEPDHLESLLHFAREGHYEFVSAATSGPDGKLKPYDLNGIKVGSIQTWLYRSYLRTFKFNPDCWRKENDRVCDTDLQARFRKAGVRMGYLDKTLARIFPKPGDEIIGLKGARIHARAYMDHLSF